MGPTHYRHLCPARELTPAQVCRFCAGAARSPNPFRLSKIWILSVPPYPAPVWCPVLEKPCFSLLRGEPPALKCDGVDQNRAKTPGTIHGTTNVSRFGTSGDPEGVIFRKQRFRCSGEPILGQNLLIPAAVRLVFRPRKMVYFCSVRPCFFCAHLSRNI